jgi:hypothetical protein
VSFPASSSSPSSTTIQVFASEEGTWLHVHTLTLQYLCFQFDFQAALVGFPNVALGHYGTSHCEGGGLPREVLQLNRMLVVEDCGCPASHGGCGGYGKALYHVAEGRATSCAGEEAENLSGAG